MHGDCATLIEVKAIRKHEMKIENILLFMQGIFFSVNCLRIKLVYF